MTITRVAALVLLAGTLVPLAALLPGGENDPLAASRLWDWALGTALCAGVGGLVAYVYTVRRRTHGTPATVAVVQPDDPDMLARAPLILILGAFALYVAVAWGIYSGRPLLVDEIVQVAQARLLAAGALAAPIVEPRVFFSMTHWVDLGDRAFGQYPIGGPAMLVPGVWLHAEWIVGPVAGALSVWGFWRLTRFTDPLASRRWRIAATALFAIAPFGAFMFGSHMNHATMLPWLLMAVLSLVRATRGLAVRWQDGLLCGLGLGVAATIRPVDAAAFALPAAAWLGWNARAGGKPLRAFLASGVGVAVPMGLMFWANARTTGHPFLFGYNLLWGPEHGLGFHESPWGAIHTPVRGLELVGLSLARLSTYLYETPFPAILPAVGSLWLARNLNALDRYLLVAGALVMGAYWAYWHDGFYPGPRFYFALLPMLVLWTARAWPMVRDELGAGSAAWRGVRAGLTFGMLYAVVMVATVRAPSYRNAMTLARVSPEHAARRAGVHDALVLVQESWGAQLIARLWELDVPRSQVEKIYATVDACSLELALQRALATQVRGEALVAQLRPLMADSARLIPSTRSPDFTEKMLPGLVYPPTCEARLALDQRGFMHLAPWRLARDGNVYARWLPGREAEIAAAFPGRRVYRVRRASADVGAPLVWERWQGPAPSNP